MDETIEKKVLEESSDFSILSMFLQADVVVKIVIVLLVFSSVWSWAIIFSKYTSLKNILLESEEFEDCVEDLRTEPEVGVTLRCTIPQRSMTAAKRR